MSATRKGRAAKYALAGLAHCSHCGGAIGSHRVRAFGGGNARILAYGCQEAGVVAAKAAAKLAA